MKNKSKIINFQSKKQEYENKLLNATIEKRELIEAFEDAQEEFLFILDNIEEALSMNRYGNLEARVRLVSEYVKKQKEILQIDLGISNKNELSNISTTR